MREDNIRIIREAPDRLRRQVYGFSIEMPQSWEMSMPDKRGVTIRMKSFSDEVRASTRHRTYEPIERCLYSGYFPNRPGQNRSSPEKIVDWLDVTKDGYAWGTGDCRGCQVRGSTPVVPQDVIEEVQAAVSVLVVIPEAKG